MRRNLKAKAFKEKVFAKGNGEFVRTKPLRNDEDPFVGYIKTILGEARVSYNDPLLFGALVGGKEITEEEYEKADLAVNED